MGVEQGACTSHKRAVGDAKELILRNSYTSNNVSPSTALYLGIHKDKLKKENCISDARIQLPSETRHSRYVETETGCLRY